MSLECSECERDIRGGHDPSCSRYRPPPKCSVCGGPMEDDEGIWCCERHGYAEPEEDERRDSDMIGQYGE